MAKMLTLVVGCGGSGITTMKSLNRMLASNPAMRTEMWKSTFYLAVDTEMAMLDSFKKDIEKDMMGAIVPYSETICLSQDVNILYQVVNPYFKKPFKGNPNDKGLARLKENWWYDDEDPFCAPLVRNLKEGAGQCPPASYCLAWWRLHDIEQAIHRVVDEMVAKGDGSPDLLSHINLFVVTGLSGGTGRGCWNIITFKIRQYIQEKYGVPVSPTGVFFDATVFANVAKDHANQDVPLKVNALTGLSELSCWVSSGRKAGKAKGTFVYRLPNLRTPSRWGTDLLNTDLDLNPVSGAPVDSAYIICGTRSAASLADNVQYHEMAGEALYAMITNSDISGQRVNSAIPYNSFAAISFTVDTIRLQSYFETIARSIALEGLAENSDSVADRVNKFFEKMPVDICVQGIGDLSPKKDGTLMQRAVAVLVAKRKGRFGDMLAELETATPASGREVVADVLGTALDKDVKAAVEKAFEEFADPKTALQEAMRSVYAGENGEQPSVGRALRFLLAVKAKIDGAKMQSVSSITMADPKRPTSQVDVRKAVLNQVDLYSGRTLGERLRGIKCFNESERSKLATLGRDDIYTGIVPSGYAAINYPKLRDAFDAKLAEMEETIKTLTDSFAKFGEVCASAKAIFDREAPIAAGGAVGQDAFRMLFATPDNIESSLLDLSDRSRFYRRILKPVMQDEDEVRQLVARSIRIESGMQKFIAKAIDSGELLALARNTNRDADAPREFLQKLLEVTRKNVSIDGDFMAENFTFVKVLQKNRSEWNKHLVEVQGNANDLAKLSQQFDNFLGVKVKRNSSTKNYELPPVSQMITDIAESMVRVCSPWWQISTTEVGRAPHTVMLFLPEKLENLTNGGTLEAELKKTLDFAIADVIGLSEKNEGGTPYGVIAYTSQGIDMSEVASEVHPLDCILSIKYYYGNSDVDEWLQLAESQAGKSIFIQKNDNKGIGYVSPIYVRNEQLSSVRWKPWTKTQPVDNEVEDKAADALLYAFLGFGLDDEARAEVESKLAAYGWTFPLIRDIGRQTYVFTRKTLVFKGEKATADTACPWKIGKGGKKICTSLCNVDAYLQGLGKVGLGAEAKEKDKEEGVDACRRVLAERDLFCSSVVPLLGNVFYGNLINALNGWLAAMRDEADEEDYPVWERLIARMNSGK